MKRIRMVLSFLRLIYNPFKIENVVHFRDAMRRMADPIKKQAVVEKARRIEGSELWFERRETAQIPHFEDLQKMPSGTFGKEYFEFMTSRNFTPEALPSKNPQNEFELVIESLNRSHDLWHVMTGADSDLAGEIQLQAFYLAQYPSELNIFLVAGALLHVAVFKMDEVPKVFEALSFGWKQGRLAKSLITMDWNRNWKRDLSSLRAEMNLISA